METKQIPQSWCSIELAEWNVTFHWLSVDIGAAQVEVLRIETQVHYTLMPHCLERATLLQHYYQIHNDASLTWITLLQQSLSKIHWCDTLKSELHLLLTVSYTSTTFTIEDTFTPVNPTSTTVTIKYTLMPHSYKSLSLGRQVSISSYTVVIIYESWSYLI